MDEQRPEVNNLMKIYCAMEGITHKEANQKFEKASMLEFKEALAASVTRKICPIGDRVSFSCS
jgi:hypothetical protein